MTPSRIVLVAGGTGGHIFPAWAVSRALSSKKHIVSWITDHRGLSYDNPPNFENILCLSIPPLSGSLWKKGLALFQFGRSFLISLCFLKKQKPHIVWGFGGYASIPPLLAAWILRIPIGIHQADALLGKANRFLARFVPDLATSFPVVEGVPPQIRQTYTGLPIRTEIEALSQKSYPQRNTASDPFYLLVIGGSQGASIWGERLPQAIALLPPEKQKLFHILQQCRPEMQTKTQEAYAKTCATVTLTPFIHDIAEALKSAHFVMARAGASTIMELAASGRTALFVPYPFAADDHQTINAQKVVAQGGGWMIPEKDFTIKTLKIFLEERLESSAQLQQYSQKIRYFWQKTAAENLARLIESRVKGE